VSHDIIEASALAFLKVVNRIAVDHPHEERQTVAVTASR
jgi:hypothetical protein